jgi:hypothetical protein
LLENELVRTRSLAFSLFSVAIYQVAKAENSTTILRLRHPNFLLPDALLDLDRPGVKMDVFPLKAQDFRDASPGCNACFYDQSVGFFE